MAIRVEHSLSPGVLGLAAYATGQGRAQQRQRKYAQDLWMQERNYRQRMAERMAGLKYRNATTSRIGGGGFWTDPLADSPSLPPEERRRRNAQRKRRERQGRLGKAVPVDQQPVYTSPATIKRQRELQDEALKRQQKLEDATRERQWDEADTAAENIRQDRKARAAGLMEVPEWAPKAIGHKLRGQYADIVQMLTGGEIDWNDTRQVADVERAIKDYEASVGGLKPPDVGAEFNRNTFYKDPNTGRVSREYQEGFVPGQISDGQWITDPDYEAQREAGKKETNTAQTELAKQQKARATEFATRMAKLRENANDPDYDWPEGMPKDTASLRKKVMEEMKAEEADRQYILGTAGGDQVSGQQPTGGEQMPDWIQNNTPESRGAMSWGSAVPQQAPRGGVAFPGLGGGAPAPAPVTLAPKPQAPETAAVVPGAAPSRLEQAISAPMLSEPERQDVAAQSLSPGDRVFNAAVRAAQQEMPSTPKTQADYDALPSGAVYIHPRDGKLRRKP